MNTSQLRVTHIHYARNSVFAASSPHEVKRNAGEVFPDSANATSGLLVVKTGLKPHGKPKLMDQVLPYNYNNEELT